MFMSINLDVPENGNWIRPNMYPCKKKFPDLCQSELDDNTTDLSNLVQRYTRRNSGYCFWTKNKDAGGQYCRFNFPFQLCTKTHVEYERIHSKSANIKCSPNNVLQRNDLRLNKHNRIHFQEWRANVDIQPMSDHKVCFEYIAKYLMKGEKLPFVVKNVFANVIRKTDENNTTIKFLASSCLIVLARAILVCRRLWIIYFHWS